MQTDSTASQRLVYLDWARIGAFGLLVFYHVGMYYVTWDWHIKSPYASAAIEPLMRLVSPWRLDLLFLVSGAATSFMLRSGAVGALLATRARRLLIPLVFGMLVVVPPQSYFEVVHKFGYTGDYITFMSLYLAGSRDFCKDGHCLILPTWNHLWFLPYLFTYTLALWAIVRIRPDVLEHAAQRIPALLRGARLLLVPILFLALSAILFARRFPVTHAWANDWFAHTQFFAMFLLGAVLARARPAFTAMHRVRWLALGIAVASWALLVLELLPARNAGLPASLLRPVLYSAQQWCAIVAVLGFARRHLTHDGPARRYLTDAVFPIYLLHQTFTILLARALAPAQIAPGAEATLLVLGTFALCFASYECVRRVRWLRPLFGLKTTSLPRLRERARVGAEFASTQNES
ncbi:MAG TPA: acyltransferase family protein [Burkholderiaceae bacterium]|nr:acyltransferase family protein [Burkholderiaceae bacterium]